MDAEPDHAASHEALISGMRDKEYRDQYVESFNRQLLARQMRGFRGSLTQAEFALTIDKSQTQIARFEDPTYGWQTRTVFEIARRQDVAAIVCFVDYETFLRFEASTENMLTPCPYDPAALASLRGSDRAPSGGQHIETQIAEQVLPKESALLAYARGAQNVGNTDPKSTLNLLGSHSNEHRRAA